MAQVRLIEAQLPDFGVPATQPELPPEIYRQRYAALGRERERAELDVIVIYADREHSANLAWLTNFDPRFEEALLVLAAGENPTLLTGPENLGRAGAAALATEVRLYPPFGLMGQDRTRTPSLEGVLRHAGIDTKHRVGLIGWKFFSGLETERPDFWSEVPSFIVDTLRSIVGPDGRVINANRLLMDVSHGLRATAEIEQIAQFEFGAVAASEAIKALLRNVRPGISEFALAQSMGLGILTHTCHTMLSTGPDLVGLNSPSGRIIERGDPLSSAVGYPGGLTSRGGFVVADESELPRDARDYVARLAAPYFACAAEWYETIGIGVTGGELDALARRHLGDPFFNLVLNPGHLIHLDEWMNTGVYPGSKQPFASGQVVQCDIIPAVGPPYYGINIEDGVALLDEAGRDELRDKFPDVWSRIEARRAFMGDVLGIRLKPEVLPLSNMCGALPPYMLAPNRLLSKR